MKKIQTITKKSLSLLLSLVMILTALPLTAVNSFAETSGDFEYEILDDGTAEIYNYVASAYTGSETNVTIPSTIDGYTVTSIGNFAFFCTSLTSITISDGVTNIGDEAFRYCTSLTSITIPDSVTSIGERAFDDTAYYNNSDNWENGVLYIGHHLIKAKPDYLASEYEIKEGTITIADEAFYYCESLTSITIPDSVTSIGDKAFAYCTSLTSITIPDSVTSIGFWAFYNTAYYNNSDNWENGVLYIGHHLIEANSADLASEYEIKEGTLIIADRAFEGCTLLESITIPDSVTSIGYRDFDTCTSLTSITIPDSVTSIGNSAFARCTSLTSIAIPDSVTSIGNSAFARCTSLTSITIPDSVKIIECGAFENCTSLENVVIGENVIEIGAYSFYNCYSIDSIIMPKNVNYIGREALGYNSTEMVLDPVTGDMVSVSEKIEGFTIYGYPDTEAERYAIDNGFEFVSIGETEDCAHTNTELRNEKAATCTVEGYTGDLYCKDCGVLITKGEAIAKLEHTVVIDESKEPTETENGLTEGSHCSVCGKVIVEQEEIPALGIDILTNDEESVSVENEDGSSFDPSVILVVKPAEPTLDEQILRDKNIVQYLVLDILLQKNEEVIQPDGNVKVYIDIPEGYDPARCVIYCLNENGQLTDMHATVEDGKLVYITNHFSVYIVAEIEAQADIMLGDVNGDGKITVVDAKWVLQAVAGSRTLTAEQITAADVNGDGKVTVVDAKWILQAVAGMRDLAK